MNYNHHNFRPQKALTLHKQIFVQTERLHEKRHTGLFDELLALRLKLKLKRIPIQNPERKIERELNEIELKNRKDLLVSLAQMMDSFQKDLLSLLP